MQFDAFQFSPSLLKTIQTQGYKNPTKIQELAIEHVRDGKDVIGCAQTGTGKTAAFALPILQNLSDSRIRRGKPRIRVLALAPTRELASQIGESFVTFGRPLGLYTTVIYGGVNQYHQTKALARGVDILVATPGRLLDLMNQGYVRLSDVSVLVLDEADRMLDMGFIHDIRKVVSATPKNRQTLLFSATLPQSIVQLADSILTDPVTVSVTPPATTVESIDQSVYFVERNQKIGLLVNLLKDPTMSRTLVFTRTKYGADKVVRKLEKASIAAAAIHGNKSQNKREQALYDFKRGVSRVLVATDIASRGLDIDQVSHVVNLDLPNEPEAYVHRIGRTGRAGKSGIAYSFCGRDERPLLRTIERLTRQDIRISQTPDDIELPQPAEFEEFEATPAEEYREDSRYGSYDGRRNDRHSDSRYNRRSDSRDTRRNDSRDNRRNDEQPRQRKSSGPKSGGRNPQSGKPKGRPNTGKGRNGDGRFSQRPAAAKSGSGTKHKG